MDPILQIILSYLCLLLLILNLIFFLIFPSNWRKMMWRYAHVWSIHLNLKFISNIHQVCADVLLTLRLRSYMQVTCTQFQKYIDTGHVGKHTKTVCTVNKAAYHRYIIFVSSRAHPVEHTNQWFPMPNPCSTAH